MILIHITITDILAFYIITECLHTGIILIVGGYKENNNRNGWGLYNIYFIQIFCIKHLRRKFMTKDGKIEVGDIYTMNQKDIRRKSTALVLICNYEKVTVLQEYTRTNGRKEYDVLDYDFSFFKRTFSVYIGQCLDNVMDITFRYAFNSMTQKSALKESYNGRKYEE